MKRDSELYIPIKPGAIKIDLPNATQITDYTCGASCLQAICNYYGVGPEDEWDYEDDMKMPKSGADPKHITKAAKKYGLHVEEFRPMTQAQLVKCLDDGKPVIIMLQAWADEKKLKKWKKGGKVAYVKEWKEGHYNIAVGYDDEVFYVEDPSIHGNVGYIKRDELDARWHDIEGKKKVHTEHLGIAIWADRPNDTFTYAKAARRVD